MCLLGPLASAFGFYFYASPDLYAEFLIFFHSIVCPFITLVICTSFHFISFISSHFILSSHRIYLFYSPELHSVSASSTANRDTSLYASSIKSFSNNALAIVQYFFYDIPDPSLIPLLVLIKVIIFPLYPPFYCNTLQSAYAHLDTNEREAPLAAKHLHASST